MPSSPWQLTHRGQPCNRKHKLAWAQTPKQHACTDGDPAPESVHQCVSTYVSSFNISKTCPCHLLCTPGSHLKHLVQDVVFGSFGSHLHDVASSLSGTTTETTQQQEPYRVPAPMPPWTTAPTPVRTATPMPGRPQGCPGLIYVTLVVAVVIRCCLLLLPYIELLVGGVQMASKGTAQFLSFNVVLCSSRLAASVSCPARLIQGWNCFGNCDVWS